jgi:hypothetical protein
MKFLLLSLSGDGWNGAVCCADATDWKILPPSFVRRQIFYQPMALMHPLASFWKPGQFGGLIMSRTSPGATGGRREVVAR